MSPKPGVIEVIAGCMYSGKTEELMRRARREIIARRKVAVFKHSLDDRYDSDKVASHNGSSLDAVPVDSADAILRFYNGNLDLDAIFIDEAQFFDRNIVSVARAMARDGVRVVLAGLDMDFRGEPFGCMPVLLSIAEKVTKLTAICNKCGEDAFFTQRFVDGRPAHYNDPIIMIGAKESYEARCRDHHDVPR